MLSEDDQFARSSGRVAHLGLVLNDFRKLFPFAVMAGKHNIFFRKTQAPNSVRLTAKERSASSSLTLKRKVYSSSSDSLSTKSPNSDDT